MNNQTFAMDQGGAETFHPFCVLSSIEFVDFPETITTRSFVCPEVDWPVWLHIEGKVTEDRVQFSWELHAKHGWDW